MRQAMKPRERFLSADALMVLGNADLRLIRNAAREAEIARLARLCDLLLAQRAYRYERLGMERGMRLGLIPRSGKQSRSAG